MKFMILLRNYFSFNFQKMASTIFYRDIVMKIFLNKKIYIPYIYIFINTFL